MKAREAYEKGPRRRFAPILMRNGQGFGQRPRFSDTSVRPQFGTFQKFLDDVHKEGGFFLIGQEAGNLLEEELSTIASRADIWMAGLSPYTTREPASERQASKCQPDMQTQDRLLHGSFFIARPLQSAWSTNPSHEKRPSTKNSNRSTYLHEQSWSVRVTPIILHQSQQ